MKNEELDNFSWEYNFKNKMQKEREVDLESSIISCILQKPELIKKTKLTKEDFRSFPKYFLFLEKMYEKFSTLDLVLMCSQLNKTDRFRIQYFYEYLFNHEIVGNFEKYEKALLERNEKLKLKYMVDDCIMELMLKKIDYEEFIENIKKGSIK